MPKVKVPRKSTTVDMTAMTDVAFLLLTFFMLATKFKPDEPVVVDTPGSVSETKLPDAGMMQLTVDKRGRVFFGMTDQATRELAFQRMAAKYKMSFTEAEVKAFGLQSTFGVPMAQMKDFLALSTEQKSKQDYLGIPKDSLANELGDWIWQARQADNNIKIAIKGDKDADMPTIKRVIAVLQEKNVNKFNLITSMKTGQ